MTKYLDIKWSTFFTKSGKLKKKDNYMNCLVCGFQGTGKTYYCVLWWYYYKKMYKTPNENLYTNIKSLADSYKGSHYVSSLEQICNNFESEKVFIIDEIASRYMKHTPQDKKFYRWLQQSRKKSRHVLMTHQEYKDIPVWLRHPCNYIITTSKLRFLPIFHTTIADGTHPTYNIDTNDWECEVVGHVIYKRTKKIASLYDTYESIETL